MIQLYRAACAPQWCIRKSWNTYDASSVGRQDRVNCFPATGPLDSRHKELVDEILIPAFESCAIANHLHGHRGYCGGEGRPDHSLPVRLYANVLRTLLSQPAERRTFAYQRTER